MSAHDTDHGGCSERHDDLAAYALGALPPAESAALERHLAGCESCRERLHWLRPAADLVPASVEQLNPPPALKRELMAIVRDEAPETAAAPAAAPERPGPVARFRMKLLGDGPLRPALAGFAVFCLVVAGIAGYELGTGDDGDSSPAKSFAVLPASPQMDGHGTVEVEGGSATLTVSDMDPIPHNEVYQAWVADGDSVQPSSIFVVDAAGGGSASIPDLPAGADRLMVTREPAGGSTQPSTAAVLSAEL
jgi:anti-sigma-K factor RskA